MDDVVTSQRELRAVVSRFHHRAKNHLQLITSVIALHAFRVTDPRVAATVGAIDRRVRAIVGAIGACSDSEMSTVHFGDYLGHLVEDVVHSFDLSDRVRVDVTAADIALDIEKAIPLALIATELTTNALEHAFPADAPGTVRVILRYSHDEPGLETAELEISDTGVPLVANWDSSSNGSMGFFLVRTLATQLCGSTSVDELFPGKTFRVRFPV